MDSSKETLMDDKSVAETPSQSCSASDPSSIDSASDAGASLTSSAHARTSEELEQDINLDTQENKENIDHDNDQDYTGDIYSEDEPPRLQSNSNRAAKRPSKDQSASTTSYPHKKVILSERQINLESNYRGANDSDSSPGQSGEEKVSYSWIQLSS
ncbi:hypothetical protein BDZ91DRAFT_796083 [Kalaharituber pfeilii]|nr:hypothetical protein BDZ91DRAFT_796083 [Kalaharituber pfeilii]